MSDEIDITVDGQPLKAKRGQMLIEVTDAAGIDIPRFCYHKKLSVAANCRMCLVEVEKAPKPLPACATPVMPDMVVKTRSSLALEAQRGTMEFLLINHPLDCPICDQGGECELQDVAMGYGGSVSQYTEGKRVVMDKYIGPLIATEMTRCIHCTRCVRFGEEVAGIRELGATGRGENVRIGTYIEKSVASEVSGNVIDICPVGALTARPSRFTARSWELQQQPSIAPHDAVGSNIFVHLDGSQINRVVPRENESINETWISDRDRFSYQGLRSADRLQQPMIRNASGELVECDWPTALDAAADAISKACKNNKAGIFASPVATLEELYLLQKLVRQAGSNNIDHRVLQQDFSNDAVAPVMPWLGMKFEDLETLEASLIVGCNVRKQLPIAAVRLRKSALAGGKISFLNPRDFSLHFEAMHNLVVRHDDMLVELASIATAAGADLSAIKDLPVLEPSETHREIAMSLRDAERGAVVLGALAEAHPHYADLQLLAAALARKTNVALSFWPSHANSCGAWLAGAVPHRTAGGDAAGGSASADASAGNAAHMFEDSTLDTFVLFGTEPEFEAANPAHASAALKRAEQVVYCSTFASENLRQHATVVLPIAAFTETYGTYVNAAGIWQSSRGVTSPPGEARPGWKVLRVLAEAMQLDGFTHDNPEQITREVQGHCGSLELNNFTVLDNGSSPRSWPMTNPGSEPMLRSGELPIYRTDPLVRRSEPLQKAIDGKQAYASLCTAEMKRLGVAAGDKLKVSQNGSSIELEARCDEGIPVGSVWVPAGLTETSDLGAVFAPVSVSAV